MEIILNVLTCCERSIPLFSLVWFGVNMDYGIQACLEVVHWPQPLTPHS